MNNEEERVKRLYDVPSKLQKWIEETARREKRPVIRQVEVILEDAMNNDLTQQNGEK